MKTLFFTFLIVFLSSCLFGQISSDLPADSVKVLITLKNGEVYSGEIIDRNDREILFSGSDAVISILLDDIQSVKQIEEMGRVRVTMMDGSEHQGIVIARNKDQLIIQNQNGKMTLDQKKIKNIEDAFEEQQIRLEMKDGTVYEGYRKSNGTEPTTIYTENGKVEYNPSQVQRISQAGRPSEYGFKNPLSNKYFLSPSAIPLRDGTSYYHNQSVAFNSFQTALNKNISIGGGLEFFSLFVSRSPLIYANIKVSGSASSRFHYGGGLFTGGVFGNDDFSSVLFAAPYAVVTIGGSEHNITLGSGVVFNNEAVDNNVLIFNISGMTRVSRKVSLISNNFFGVVEFEEYPSFGIQGVRIMNESNAFDIGLIINPELLSEGVVLPYAGFIQRF